MSRPDRIIDCHAHVIDPARFRFAEGPGYRPRPDEVGTADDFEAVLGRNHAWGAVLVQPSGYGFDNAAMLDAIARRPTRLKGIAMLDPDAGDAVFEDLSRRGVVGVRFNLGSYDGQALERPGIGPFLARLKAFGWFAEVFANDAQWVQAAPLLRSAGVKVLVDHFGVSDVGAGPRQPGFQAMLALGREGLSAIKLSAPFRISGRPGTYEDLAPYAEAILDAFGLDACVWGSDWPFLGTTERPSYADQLAALGRWLPDEEDRDRVLWRNPARLFGFGEAK
jgi:predicted TIM-barrel fold metal-dependent hydrolase